MAPTLGLEPRSNDPKSSMLPIALDRNKNYHGHDISHGHDIK